MVIIIGDGLSSQQMEQFSSDSTPLAGKETTPIATWANFDGAQDLQWGQVSGQKLQDYWHALGSFASVLLRLELQVSPHVKPDHVTAQNL